MFTFERDNKKEKKTTLFSQHTPNHYESLTMETVHWQQPIVQRKQNRLPDRLKANIKSPKIFSNIGILTKENYPIQTMKAGGTWVLQV